jgi:predicted ATPase
MAAQVMGFDCPLPFAAESTRMNQTTPNPFIAKITDHHNNTYSINLADYTFHGQAVKPGYLEQTPNRIGSDWLVTRMNQGRPLELWQARDGRWLVVDRAGLDGVVLNGDQLRDLRPLPSSATTPPHPMTITLEAQNFRALRRTNWAPSGVCVIVGPNGAGKTTLLTLLDFLHSAYLQGPYRAIDRIGGVYGLRSWAAPDDEAVVVAIKVGDLRWELQLTAQGPTLSERLGERVIRKMALGDDVVLHRAAMSQRLVYCNYEQILNDSDDRLALRIGSDANRADILSVLIDILKNLLIYRNYNLANLRENGSRHGGDLQLHPSGQNVFTVLRNWRDRRDLKPQYEYVITHLRSAFPEVFADLDFQVAGLTVTVDLIDPRSNESCPLALAPDGWITGLLHLTAVAGAARNSFIAIDDFGNDLHPYAIRKLTQAFRIWAEERNLIICLASHSPVLLDEFKEHPESVFVMEPGLESRPVPLTDLYESDWLDRFSLGRLYQHGEFGGQAPKVNGSVRGSQGQHAE